MDFGRKTFSHDNSLKQCRLKILSSSTVPGELKILIFKKSHNREMYEMSWWSRLPFGRTIYWVLKGACQKCNVFYNKWSKSVFIFSYPLFCYPWVTSFNVHGLFWCHLVLTLFKILSYRDARFCYIKRVVKVIIIKHTNWRVAGQANNVPTKHACLNYSQKEYKFGLNCVI